MSGGIVVSSDSNWSSCVLLLNMEKTNGSATTTTDASNSAHACTIAGTASLQTGTKKFGESSLNIPGATSAYLECASSSDFALGGNKFTIRFWMNQAYYIYGGRILSANSGSIAWNSSGINWLFTVLTSSTITFQYYTGSSQAEVSGAISTGNWTHVEVDYDGSTIYLFIDGVLAASKSTTVSASTAAPYLRVGGLYGESSYPFNGYIDDVQIYKGVCLHTAAFSVPTRQLSRYITTFSGTALTSTGAAADYVAVWKWPNGTTRTLTTPSSDGSWSITIGGIGDFGFTYIADGFKPLTHGPYTAAAS